MYIYLSETVFPVARTGRVYNDPCSFLFGSIIVKEWSSNFIPVFLRKLLICKYPAGVLTNHLLKYAESLITKISLNTSMTNWGIQNPRELCADPTLFSPFTKLMISNWQLQYNRSSSSIYANDTTFYSIGTKADEVTCALNCALHEVYEWCKTN